MRGGSRAGSFTVLAAVPIHKGSAESRDSDDEMKATLERIEKKVDEVRERAA